MGRAGSGSSSNSSHSSSSHSVSRSSGSHHVSSSSSSRRAGSSSSGGFNFSGGSSLSNNSYHSHHHYHHNTPYYGSDYTYPNYPRGVGYGTSGMSIERSARRLIRSITSTIVTFFLIAVIFAVVLGAQRENKITDSTLVRTKLDSGNSFVNECIVDELGWFDNISQTESRLRKFYDETGIQPYIVLRSYDSSLLTDAEKEQFTAEYFEENALNENGFLFMYFAEQDQDNDVGTMCYTNGYQTSAVMDSEAVNIFWDYVDCYWYTDMSTDDMFVTIFNGTADKIMHVSTTSNDVKLGVIIFCIAVAGIIGTVLIIVLIRRSRREEAAETQRILNTPLDKIKDTDDLVDKYSN